MHFGCASSRRAKHLAQSTFCTKEHISHRHLAKKRSYREPTLKCCKETTFRNLADRVLAKFLCKKFCQKTRDSDVVQRPDEESNDFFQRPFVAINSCKNFAKKRFVRILSKHLTKAPLMETLRKNIPKILPIDPLYKQILPSGEEIPDTLSRGLATKLLIGICAGKIHRDVAQNFCPGDLLWRYCTETGQARKVEVLLDDHL